MLVFGLCCFTAISLVCYRDLRNHRWQISDLVVVAFLLWPAINPHHGNDGNYLARATAHVCASALYVLARSTANQFRLRTMMGACLILSALCLLYGLPSWLSRLEQFSKIGFVDPSIFRHHLAFYVTESSFGNPVPIYILGIAVALTAFVDHWPGTQEWNLIFPSLTLIACTYLASLSFARATYIAVLLEFAIFVFVLRRNGILTFRRIVLPFYALLLVVLLHIATGTLQGAVHVMGVLHGQSQIRSAHGHISQSGNMLDAVAASLPRGVGTDASLISWPSLHLVNAPLTYVLEQGLLGLAFLSGTTVILAIKALRCAQSAKGRPTVLLGGILATALHGLFWSTLVVDSPSIIMFGTALALVD